MKYETDRTFCDTPILLDAASGPARRVVPGLDRVRTRAGIVLSSGAGNLPMHVSVRAVEGSVDERRASTRPDRPGRLLFSAEGAPPAATPPRPPPAHVLSPLPFRSPVSRMKGLPKKIPGKIPGKNSLRSFRTWGGAFGTDQVTR